MYHHQANGSEHQGGGGPSCGAPAGQCSRWPLRRGGTGGESRWRHRVLSGHG
jgi:hypothetical protein